jgi:hypothetical protein
MSPVNEKSASGKTWWAPLWQGLVMDPQAKHYRRLGQAVWLFLYFLLNANRRTGLLMRRAKTISTQTGFKARTIRKWLKTLRDEGYIRTRCTGRYLEIEICRWKTIASRHSLAGQSGKNLPTWAAQSCRTARAWERGNLANESANFFKHTRPK